MRNNDVGVDVRSYFDGSITFLGNTICSNTTYNLELNYQNNADLSGNCWCSIDEATIKSKILDGFINTSKGLVNVLPLGSNCPASPLGINKTTKSSELNIKVYPNPVQAQLNLEFQNAKEQLVTIYNVTGKLIKSKKFKAYNATIDMSDFVEGIYILKIVSEDGVLNKQILKN